MGLRRMNGDFEVGEPELGAGSTLWSDRFAGADEDQVARLRLLDKVVAQALLELVRPSNVKLAVDCVEPRVRRASGGCFRSVSLSRAVVGHEREQKHEDEFAHAGSPITMPRLTQKTRSVPSGHKLSPGSI